MRALKNWLAHSNPLQSHNHSGSVVRTAAHNCISAKAPFVALMLMLLAGASLGQSLSKQNLIDLKKAGVSDPVLVKQIEKDGISFEMNAATTIELKNLGFSDDILSALLNGASKKSNPTSDDPVKTLYTQGKYPELCDYVKSQLAKDPRNYRLQAILIGALLKINQPSLANAELEKLKNDAQDPAGKPYLDRASLVVSLWQKQQEGKQRLLAALQNFSYADADSAVDQLSASMMQKMILHMVIDSYAARFDTALSRYPQLQTISFADKQRVDAIKQKVLESQKVYDALMSQADVYYHSPLVPSVCGAGLANNPDLKYISIRQYGDLVGNLTKTAPLSDDVMDMAFHLTFLTAKYEEVETLGDKILSAKGAIHIPFYSRDRYFTVTIDMRRQRIYTHPDPHPFSARYAPAPGGFSLKYNIDHNDWNADLVPFDLAFDQIRNLSQKARGKAGGNVTLVPRSYALAFDPAGVAPNYALMHFIFCTEGEEAELLATRNLGLFVVHVIGNPKLKTELADPQKASHGGGSGWGDAIVAMYGATHGTTPLGATAMQMATENKARSEAATQEQQATWQTMLARDYSSLMDGSVFEGLDKLIENQ